MALSWYRGVTRWGKDLDIGIRIEVLFVASVVLDSSGMGVVAGQWHVWALHSTSQSVQRVRAGRGWD